MGVGVAGVANYTNTSSGTVSNVVAYGGVGGPYEYCSFFSVLNWFAKGEQGAWYDPSDLTSLFQDSAGTTPMATVGTVADQPVGLMLDKSKGLALGAELVTNGDFSNGSTGWTVNAWTVSSGVASLTAGTDIIERTPNATLVSGAFYSCTITTSNYVSGSVYFWIGGTIASPAKAFSGNGTYTCILYLTATTAKVGVYGSDFTGSVDNISVKQIAGNHAYQDTSANRPILSARVNLLTKTQDFSDAVWVKNIGGTGVLPVVTLNAGVAPDGTSTAAQVVFNSGVGATSSDISQLEYYQINKATIGTSYTSGVWVKGVAGQKIQIRQQAASGYTLYTLTGNWDYFTQVEISTLTVAIINIGLRQVVNGTINSNITVLLWHPDLRPTNSGALLPPYQRVNTASDYDSVGFPLYLKCNGTSSAMSTNSIDFTATDKMTVVTGFRTAVIGGYQILGLSSDPTTIDGSFFVSSGAAVVGGPRLGGTVRGTSALNYDSPDNWQWPVPVVISNNYNIAGTDTYTRSGLKVNGSVQTPLASGGSGSTGSGNFSNNPIYLFAVGGTSIWTTGNFYGAVIRGAQSDTASVTQTENYMAQKTGITF